MEWQVSRACARGWRFNAACATRNAGCGTRRGQGGNALDRMRAPLIDPERMSRIALVAGHTGLVGHHLLAALLEDQSYDGIKAVGRRPPAFEHPRLQLIQTELGDLRQCQDRLQGDDAFCCLGTTQKAAGSRTAFERVDFHMVVDFARVAHAAGARRLFLVSSLSASARSPVYYSRVKGRTERAVSDIGYDTVHVVRPSLLLGARQDARPGEALAQRLAPILNALIPHPLRRYRAVPAIEVAQALVTLAQRQQSGTHIHHLPLDA
mgnify:CR=1 FL=1